MDYAGYACTTILLLCLHGKSPKWLLLSFVVASPSFFFFLFFFLLFAVCLRIFYSVFVFVSHNAIVARLSNVVVCCFYCNTVIVTAAAAVVVANVVVNVVVVVFQSVAFLGTWCGYRCIL